MKFSNRDLLTRANGDRLFAYGSFVALFGGIIAIKAFVTGDDTSWVMSWGCFVLVIVGAGMWLTRRSTDSRLPAPNPPKD